MSTTTFYIQIDLIAGFYLFHQLTSTAAEAYFLEMDFVLVEISRNQAKELNVHSRLHVCNVRFGICHIAKSVS